jgi:hypothetical protein
MRAGERSSRGQDPSSASSFDTKFHRLLAVATNALNTL